MKTIGKYNNPNDYSKRTTAHIKWVLKKNEIDAISENLGDGRSFYLNLEPNIKNLVILKQIGFIIQHGNTKSGTVIKAY